MTNASSTAGVTLSPHGVGSGPELKSAPLVVGSAIVSECISTVGVDINDIRPWTRRDIEDYRECPIDRVLQELLYRCVDRSKLLPDKPTLLADCLKAVLPICNKGRDAQIIKQCLGDLMASTVEEQMHKYFIQASNLALDRLGGLDAPGLVSSKAHDDDKIMFHYNDPKNVTQQHRGERSIRKPDVVIVSRACAKKVRKKWGQAYKDGEASEKPSQQFQWTDIRSTVEFKHKNTQTSLSTPPATYAANAYNIPEAKKYHINYRRETNNAAEPTGLASLPRGGIATNLHQTSDARGCSTSRALNNKKRGSSRTPDDHSSKKIRVDDDEQEPQKIHPVLHNRLYTAELVAAHVLRQSVITYVVDNDMIYLWYFDRQDAIQCSGINFVQDLPRFMVLLLAIQRMPYVEWGYNPIFEPGPGSSGEVRVLNKKIGQVDLTLDSKSDKRTTHFGLRGRATTVFPVKSKALSDLVPTLPRHNPHNTTNELVAKLYWPEEERESEPAIPEKVYEIARKDEEGKVRHHVPEMVWFHKFEDTSTAKIRKALGLEDAERGRRVLCIIISRKLDPITNLSDKHFLAAWWHTTVCHYALWTNEVCHRDVSPSNLVVYKTSDGRYIGVLIDFDLSSTQDSPSDQERTGTVPFMAIELLTKEAAEGQVKHLYQHNAESFIWVLTWVCLRYQEGQLLHKGRPLDQWLNVDINTCREKKSDFMMSGRREAQPSSSHRSNWQIALSCLLSVVLFYVTDPPRTVDDEIVFRTWLEKHVLEAEIPLSLLNVRLE